MPSFAISKFTVLLEPLWVSAEFLFLSTSPNLDGSQSAVLSTLLVIQLFGSVFPPPNFSKEHQKERCGHFRPQRSFITFHGALWNILLSAGFPAMFHMIALEQTFVNGSLQKFFLLLLPFQIESILSVICISFLR